jgi:hypothetical protein
MIAGGGFLGPDTTCDQCQAPPTRVGACCFTDGTCELLTCHACHHAGGEFLGVDTTCDMCGGGDSSESEPAAAAD